MLDSTVADIPGHLVEAGYVDVWRSTHPQRSRILLVQPRGQTIDSGSIMPMLLSHWHKGLPPASSTTHQGSFEKPIIQRSSFPFAAALYTAG